MVTPDHGYCVLLSAQTGSQETLEHAKLVLEFLSSSRVLNMVAPTVSSQ